jgi:DNA-binding CsgD family transcriptional regulator
MERKFSFITYPLFWFNKAVCSDKLQRQGGSGGTSGALLFAFDPEAGPPLKAELVKKLFSLTEAEAHLAVALCDGKTLEEISVERGTTVNTVRSQLKSVFGKTGASRQADLVSLILASPAYLLSH